MLFWWATLNTNVARWYRTIKSRYGRSQSSIHLTIYWLKDANTVFQFKFTFPARLMTGFTWLPCSDKIWYPDLRETLSHSAFHTSVCIWCICMSKHVYVYIVFAFAILMLVIRFPSVDVVWDKIPYMWYFPISTKCFPDINSVYLHNSPTMCMYFYIIPILQIRKLSHRAVEQLTQGLSRKWQGQD